MGSCRFVDLKFHEVFDKIFAWVLIEIPFTGGLPVNIDLQWEGSVYKKKIYYWKVPFRCHLCHETGHLMRNFRSWRDVYKLAQAQKFNQTAKAIGDPPKPTVLVEKEITSLSGKIFLPESTVYDITGNKISTKNAIPVHNMESGFGIVAREVRETSAS